jgi:hypothetical protein
MHQLVAVRSFASGRLAYLMWQVRRSKMPLPDCVPTIFTSLGLVVSLADGCVPLTCWTLVRRL